MCLIYRYFFSKKNLKQNQRKEYPKQKIANVAAKIKKNFFIMNPPNKVPSILTSTKVILPHFPEQKPFSVAGEHERNLEHLLAAHGETLCIAVFVNLGERGLCDFINVFAFVHF